jgi:hypothetical protein
MGTLGLPRAGVARWPIARSLSALTHGFARAMVYALTSRGFRLIAIVNRTHGGADAHAVEFGGGTLEGSHCGAFGPRFARQCELRPHGRRTMRSRSMSLCCRNASSQQEYLTSRSARRSLRLLGLRALSRRMFWRCMRKSGDRRGADRFDRHGKIDRRSHVCGARGAGL